ncbi:MAG: phosphoribosylformylglycinamidine synthase subunit PurS [Thermoproteota archaeon]
MPAYSVLLVITYKRSARDPEGETLARELRVLGYSAVKEVRVGKAMIFTVEAGSERDASRLVVDLAEQTRLYNPAVHSVEVVILGEGRGGEVSGH